MIEAKYWDTSHPVIGNGKYMQLISVYWDHSISTTFYHIRALASLIHTLTHSFRTHFTTHTSDMMSSNLYTTCYAAHFRIRCGTAKCGQIYADVCRRVLQLCSPLDGIFASVSYLLIYHDLDWWMYVYSADLTYTSFLWACLAFFW